MIGLILASSLVVPQSTDQTVEHLLKRVEAVSTAEITVAEVEVWADDEGKVHDCTVLRLRGVDEIAESACEAVLGAKMRPARDENGQSVHGAAIIPLSVHPEGIPAELHAGRMRASMGRGSVPTGMIVGLSQMPEELAANPEIALTLSVGADGKTKQCEPVDGSSEQWAEIACQQAQNATFDLHRSDDGQAVPYVRSLAVRFEVSS